MPDITPPTIAISSSASSLRSSQTALITFSLSEPSTDFVLSDIRAFGGTLSNFSGSGAIYSATFTPSSVVSQSVSIEVFNDSFSDASGNRNSDESDLDNRVEILVDTVPPFIWIYANRHERSNTTVIVFNLSEDSTDFTENDISVAGGTLSNFAGSGQSYSATLTASTLATNTVTVSVSDGAFSDAIGNLNLQSYAVDNNISQAANAALIYINLNSISGTSGDETLIGSIFNDYFDSLGGNDTIYAGDGNDAINGSSSGSSQYLTSAYWSVWAGSLLAFGGEGNDDIFGTFGNDELYGDAGDDFLFGDTGNDRLYGGAGVDTLNGLEGDDILNGGIDNDYLYGGFGNDIIQGGTGSDRLYGEAGNDELSGDEGNDHLSGGEGSDYLFGGDGDDELYGQQGTDFLFGGNGNDTLTSWGGGNDQLYGGAGDDVLQVQLDFTNNPYVTKFYGESGNDTLYGSKGEDQLCGGAGDDQINGGWFTSEADTAFYVGNFSHFSLTAERNSLGEFQGRYFVTDRFGHEGTDTVFSTVEYLNFNNGKTIVTLNNTNGTYTYVTLNSSPTGSVGISGTVQQGEVLASTNSLVDEDGVGNIKHQWSSSDDGYNWTNESIGTTFKLTESQVGKFIKVTASYVDGIGTFESVASSSTISVVNVNDAPSGSVVVDGTAKEGYVLSASNTIADIDGLGLIKYKWQSSLNGSKWTDVANGNSLKLDQTHVGQQIRAVGYYNDGHGTYEAVSSSSTVAIAPLIRTYLNNLSVIVAPGVVGKDAVFLKDLIEVMTYKSGGLISQTIGYSGISYQYSQIDPLITVVTRNSDFTSEFTKEINDYLKREDNLSYAEAVKLVGISNVDSTLLKIAGSDGNFVG